MEQCIFVGNLGQDAEKRTRTTDGHEFLSFSLGVDRLSRDGEGKSSKSTKWLSCTFSRTELHGHLKKGTKVAVVGTVDAEVNNREGGPQARLKLSVNSLELC